MATYAQQLADVETAISAVLAGKMQSFQIAGRAVTMLPLKDLYAERARLTPLAAREAAGGGISVSSGVLDRE